MELQYKLFVLNTLRREILVLSRFRSEIHETKILFQVNQGTKMLQNIVFKPNDEIKFPQKETLKAKCSKTTLF